MGSKKRKRGGGSGGGGGGERRSIHPRNRYADNPPDFSLLAFLYPSFSSFVFYSRDGRPRIDWTDFNATRELTRVLLLHDHSLNWWIPDGQLCPTVPNRSNYIHWIEDLLASDFIEKNNVDGAKVRGFDIGTGANCIYPLFGASLLGWSFVGSDVTDVALEWAEKNVKSNPHISELIEIRRVEVAGPANDCETLHLDGNKTSGDCQEKEDVDDLTKHETRDLDEPAVIDPEGELDIVHSVNGEEVEGLDERRDDEAQAQSLSPPDEPKIDKGYHGPPILLGVVKEGEKFDFCMCNPPFFESMEEAGLNPKTSCGGTPKEMVCPGGEGAFISRIIEDSVALKQSFRWYTSMLGKKSNLKFLMSKLREVGVTIVKTTEFVQGQTSRWGLAWSFMPQAKILVSSHVRGNSSPSFMLEGLQHQTSAFDVLQSVESFFSYFGVSCKCNDSSFTVEVSATNDHCDTMLKTDVKNLDEASTCLRVAEISRSANCSNSPVNLSFRVLVFQHIPGTLLVKASLKPGDNTLAGIFTTVFQQLEEFLKHKFCRKKVLLGCDGVNSVVGKWLGFKKPSLTGRSAVRGCAYYKDGHGFEPKFHQLVGNGVRYGIVPCDDTAVYWFLTWSPSSEENKNLQEADQLKLKQFVLSKLGKVPDQIKAVIEDTKVEEIVRSPLGYRPPWEILYGNISKDNVCVAGDACHPMTPDLGQGGCSALEDGVILGRCLADALVNRENEDQHQRIKNGLQNYAKMRRWRVFDLISTGYMLGWIQEFDWFGMRIIREKFLSAYLSGFFLKKADVDPRQFVLEY